MKTISRIFALSTLFLMSLTTAQAKNAEQIFDAISKSVYQVRIIDNRTSEKGSIGSGFLLNYKGKDYMVSNYHVISEYALSPEKNRIEYYNNGVELGTLKLAAIDVVHDLALLEGYEKSSKPLELTTKEVRQGGRIFSLGNPLDLGLTITEGTHNGYKQLSWREILMFSGALNPGMSGGAGVNDNGELIGVNVAMQGNDVGFFVPAKFVIEMIENYEASKYKGDWREIIQAQILEEEERVLNEILDSKVSWAKPENINDAFVEFPQDIHTAIKCWGGSSDEGDSRYNEASKYCSASDDIFVNSGEFFQRFQIQSTQYENKTLSTLAFYNIYSSGHKIYGGYGETGKARKCEDGFISHANREWKTIFCVQRKKKFSKLYDVSFAMSLLGHNEVGQTIKIEMDGFSKGASQKLIQAFVEETQ